MVCIAQQPPRGATNVDDTASMRRGEDGFLRELMYVHDHIAPGALQRGAPHSLVKCMDTRACNFLKFLNSGSSGLVELQLPFLLDGSLTPSFRHCDKTAAQGDLKW